MSLTPSQLAAKWSLPIVAFDAVLRTDITLDFLMKRIRIMQGNLDKLAGGAIYFGDSLANNFAYSPAVGAAGWKPGADLGLPGDTCAMMQYRLQAEPGYDFSGITAANCYATIVQATTNDVGKTTDDPATIIDRGLGIIATLFDRVPSVPIFVMALYPRGPRFVYPLDGGRIAAINATLHEIDAARNWPFRLIDVNTDIHAACDPDFAAPPIALTGGIVPGPIVPPATAPTYGILTVDTITPNGSQFGALQYDDLLSQGGVLGGTVLGDNISGTAGGIGTYKVNKPQTVADGTAMSALHQQCPIYQDETHVGAPVYAAAISAIKAAYVNPIPYTRSGGESRTSRQLGGAPVFGVRGSRSLTGDVDG